MRKFDSAGNLLFSYPVVGNLGSLTSSGALALANGVLYYNNGDTIYKGVITGSNVVVSQVGVIPASNPIGQITDGGSCPATPAGTPVTVANLDTVFRCTPAPVPVSVAGNGPFTWTVASGTATLSSTTGSAITITPTSAISRIAVAGTPAACGLVFTDTVTVILPTAAALDAGPPKNYINCGNRTIQLSGSLAGAAPGVTYALAWSPMSGVVNGGTTLTPTVSRTATTVFTLAATTPPSQGGCTLSDTTTLTVQSTPPFTLSSSPDSVFCTPPSANYFLFSQPTPAAGYYRYLWSGAPLSATSPSPTSPNPRPLTTTGTRTYFVEVKDTFGCHTRRDTVTLTFHNLTATLTPPAANSCPGDTIALKAEGSTAPTATGPPPRWAYAWSPTTGLYCTACAATIARPSVTTTYGVTLRDSLTGCALYRSSLLTGFTDLDSFSAGPDIVVRPGAGSGGLAPFTLLGRAPAGVLQLAWTPANPLERPFEAVTGGRVDSTTAFVLRAFNGPCKSEDTAVVYVVGCAGVRMPNAFSPNGNGQNEHFKAANAALLEGEAITVKSFKIFNRWGTLVHSEGGLASPGQMTGWDGKLNGEAQPAGVYVWMAEGECTDKATGERTVYEGRERCSCYGREIIG